MTEKTMNVIRVHEAGGPEVLKYEQAPVPEPGDGEVLVRVHAVGLNPPDWYLRDGMRSLPAELRPPIDFPLILGSDISGVVATVGSDVTGFAPGVMKSSDSSGSPRPSARRTPSTSPRPPRTLL